MFAVFWFPLLIFFLDAIRNAFLPHVTDDLRHSDPPSAQKCALLGTRTSTHSIIFCKLVNQTKVSFRSIDALLTLDTICFARSLCLRSCYLTLLMVTCPTSDESSNSSMTPSPLCQCCCCCDSRLPRAPPCSCCVFGDVCCEVCGVASCSVVFYVLCGVVLFFRILPFPWAAREVPGLETTKVDMLHVAS